MALILFLKSASLLYDYDISDLWIYDHFFCNDFVFGIREMGNFKFILLILFIRLIFFYGFDVLV